MIGPVALQSMIGLAMIAGNLDWNYLSSAIHHGSGQKTSCIVFFFSRRLESDRCRSWAEMSLSLVFAARGGGRLLL